MSGSERIGRGRGQEANGGKLPLQAVAAPPPPGPGMNLTARPLSEGGAVGLGQASLLGSKNRMGFWFQSTSHLLSLPHLGEERAECLSQPTTWGCS